MNLLNLPESMRRGLEDLIGDMVYARRNADLGRLALLCYCEVRHWARLAGELRLAQLSYVLITEQPVNDRKEFLRRVDDVMAELEGVCERAGIKEGLKSLENVRLQ
ncbi:hypothetical protein QTI66_29210 [Variovorax sp. J22R133]|uniref:hypothetical protein n=1 Tax=Variovorax brevis TaxID=3053503 RepID=UPI002578D677|nr:hypothetical protein [Variovorax sp. J22R133]MDM0116247.1 hypothetical protein [Variovorax sp. J22R133]